MIKIVIADTGPLIALARAGYLRLLHVLYKKIFIPPALHAELCLGSGQPGSKSLSDAIDKGWLKIKKPPDNNASTLSQLALILDLGEAEANCTG